MKKVFDYWVIYKMSAGGGTNVITETLNFTTKEKADKYYKEHLEENSWYEHMNPPTLKVIEIDFVEQKFIFLYLQVPQYMI